MARFVSSSWWTSTTRVLTFLLFLRPTESLTIFLQQLGHGLRLAEGKECLTVLDFIG